MKIISNLIILLFLFLSYSSISQSLKENTIKEQEAVNSRTPLDSNRYRNIQAHKPQQKQVIIDNEDKDQKQVKKAKSEAVMPIQKPKVGSVLDEFISQYWRTQEDIKKDQNLSKKRIDKTVKIKESESLSIEKNWAIIIKRLEIDSISKNLANNISFDFKNENCLNFLINKDLEGIVTTNSKEKLEEALSNYFKKNIDIKISVSDKNLSTIQKNDEKDYNDKISSANKKIEDDDFIKTIKEKFNAKSIENSVQIDD